MVAPFPWNEITFFPFVDGLPVDGLSSSDREQLGKNRAAPKLFDAFAISHAPSSDIASELSMVGFYKMSEIGLALSDIMSDSDVIEQGS